MRRVIKDLVQHPVSYWKIRLWKPNLSSFYSPSICLSFLIIPVPQDKSGCRVKSPWLFIVTVLIFSRLLQEPSLVFRVWRQMQMVRRVLDIKKSTSTCWHSQAESCLSLVISQLLIMGTLITVISGSLPRNVQLWEGKGPSKCSTGLWICRRQERKTQVRREISSSLDKFNPPSVVNHMKVRSN